MLARPSLDGSRRRSSATAALSVALLAGCATGVDSLQEERLRYNEVVKSTSEEQLLLNIVRLRYTDTPSSLSVTAIAMQSEVQKSVQVVPFFTAAGDAARSFTSGLPQAQISTTDRPTITLTPLDDQEFTRRLFTPMTAEGVLYLVRATWPISTVFRLWLENLNWVSNSPSGSGPTPQRAPAYTDFQRGIESLQVLQDRGLITFTAEEREEPFGSIPADKVTAKDLLDAAKDGYEYRFDEQAKAWTLLKRKRVPVMRVHPDAVKSPHMDEVARTFRLRRGLAKYEIEIEKLDPFSHPPRGFEILDLDTRSLLQVMFFVSKGVEIPPEHVEQGIVRATNSEQGESFDWEQVTRALFRARWTKGDKPPAATTHVATKYQGHWFYIDKRDQDTMSTFSLLIALGRLELPSRQSQGPALTLPLGAR